jgi:mxaK protein
LGVRRRNVHLAFGAATFVCAALVAYEAWRLRDASSVNDAITHAASAATAPTSVPEAQFAQAVVLARAGKYEDALQRYKVIARGSQDELAIDALYNTGNLHFREAVRGGPDSAQRRVPLLELAKQSYRAALRRDPSSWDARYNLERTLWLAPEFDQTMVESVQRDAENRVMSTLSTTRGDLP